MNERVAEIFEENGFFWFGRRNYNLGKFVLSEQTLLEIKERKLGFTAIDGEPTKLDMRATDE